MRIKSLPQTEKITVAASLLMIVLLHYTYFFTLMQLWGYDYIFYLSILLFLNIGIRISDILRENRIIRRLVHFLMFALGSVSLYFLIWFVLFTLGKLFLWLPLIGLLLTGLLLYGTYISVRRYGTTED